MVGLFKLVRERLALKLLKVGLLFLGHSDYLITCGDKGKIPEKFRRETIHEIFNSNMKTELSAFSNFSFGIQS